MINTNYLRDRTNFCASSEIVGMPIKEAMQIKRLIKQLPKSDQYLINVGHLESGSNNVLSPVNELLKRNINIASVVDGKLHLEDIGVWFDNTLEGIKKNEPVKLLKTYFKKLLENSQAN